MKSNYRPLGDFIELVDVRNKDLSVNHLLGLSITKEFIPSVANTVGTNMSNYKIIKKNQFACSMMQVRRDKKMPVALLKDFDVAIISQAYPVFQVIDEDELTSDYLMMWFSRAEFDRHASFLAVGGVRGSLEWDDFLEMELPVPSIEKQREIVKEYNTIVNRIKLNEQLNQKLEETAQALYTHWFVDFEFPNENGQPYKSSGGEMVYNEELDQEIPIGWKPYCLNKLFNLQGGSQPPASEFIYKKQDGYIRFVQTRDYSTDSNLTYIPISTKNKTCSKTDIMLARYGASVGKILYGIAGAYNVALVKVIPMRDEYQEFLRCYFNDRDFQDLLYSIGSGKSAREGFSKDEIFIHMIPFPKLPSLLSHFNKLAVELLKNRFHNDEMNYVLFDLRNIVLSKMSQVEFPTAEQVV